jgi:hypothetical protein
MPAPMVLVGKPPKEARQGTRDAPQPVGLSPPRLGARPPLTGLDQERGCLDEGRHGEDDADDQIDVGGGHDDHPFRPAHP